MSIEAAACAAAARSLGYPTFAQLIIDRQLPPSAVADLFRHSVVKDGMTLAVILLAADGNGFDRACKRATRLVAEHWSEIAAEA